ncbi:MAG: aspartyl protease family protein [Pseudomonadota bacterium]
MMKLSERGGILIGLAIIAMAAAPVPPVPGSPAEMSTAPATGLAQPFAADEDTETLAIDLDQTQRMTVPVTINGEGPFPFVIDTGAERTFVSEELAARLGLVAEDEISIQTVSGTYSVPLIPDADILVSGNAQQSVEMPILPRRSLGAEGILGLDTLANTHILFDIAERTMAVRPSAPAEKKKRRERLEPGTIVVTAERRHGRLIFTEAKMNGVEVGIVLDTGAEMSLGNLALRNALLKKRREEEDGIELIDVMGVSLDAELGRVRRLVLDDLMIRGGVVAFSDAPVFAKLDMDDAPALLLGMETMRAFEAVSVDFPKRQVRFQLPATAVKKYGLRHNCGGTRITRYGC